MRLSLGAAAVLIIAAALNTGVRRARLAALCGLALILAVSQLVRMAKEPLLNGLNIVPLLLIGCAAMLGRGAVARSRGLARERAQARSDGEQRERRRWARELHDETLQELVAVQIVLSTAAGSGESAAMKEAIDQARGLIANQITSLRHLIVEMRPFALDQLGLAPALETLCEPPARGTRQRRSRDQWGGQGQRPRNGPSVCHTGQPPRAPHGGLHGYRPVGHARARPPAERTPHRGFHPR